MRIISLIFVVVFLIQQCASTCFDNQIDINSAPKEELIKIIYIGEVRAEQLIELRPFVSIDELTKIKGIGEVYLSKIKEEGLACVSEIEDDEKEEKQDEKQEEPNSEELNINNIITEDRADKNKTLEIIRLNTKDIKTENNKEEELKKSDKGNYAKYGFVIFCVLLGFLFVIRKIKFRKNGFD